MPTESGSPEIKQSQTAEEITRLFYAAEWLEKRSEEFEKRFNSVLRNEPASGAVAQAVTSTPEYRVPLALDLNILFQRLSAVDDRLQSILQRTEL